MTKRPHLPPTPLVVDQRLPRGFSLIEVLASVVILSIFATGVTAIWRLADDQEFAARIDFRAAEVLREICEQQLYSGPNKPSLPPLLYLYHPLKKGNDQKDGMPHLDEVKAQVEIKEGKLSLTYELPANGRFEKRTMTKSLPLVTP
jgi:prepilin-type N-terminal cleavage/methylation domain-containing protein